MVLSICFLTLLEALMAAVTEAGPLESLLAQQQ
jgi:hypothetical protein